MFNLKNLLFGDSNKSPSSVSGEQKEQPNSAKNIKNKTKETAQKLVNVINDDSLETFSKNSTDVEILGAVYNMMVKTYSDEKLREEMEVNNAEQKEIRSQQRHDELIKALSSLSFTTKPVKQTKKVKKGNTQDKIIPEISPKGVPKTTPQKVPKQSTEKPTASKQPATKSEKPVTTPPKVSGTPPVPSVGKGAVAVAAGAGILGSVSSQMAKAETTSGPDAYTQANIVGKPGPEHQIKKGNTDVTTGKKFTKDLTEMTIGEVADLGTRRRKHYNDRGGSAMGKYQFVPGTLIEQAKKAFGEEWKNIPFTPDNQDILNGQFIKSNAQKLTDAGIPVNTASLYMMHFLGDVRKVEKILSANDETPMSSFLSTKEIGMNPSIATMSVGEYRQHLQSKGYDYNSIDNKTLQSEPLYNKPASSINSSSLENRDLNESLNTPIVASNVVNQNNYNMYQQQHRPTQSKNIDDRSAFERKSRVA